MKYIFATENKNYEDYSSGRVLYNLPGTTSFPVRLTSEIYQRCADTLKHNNIKPPYTIYDPCCGGGYLLTFIGFLFGNKVSKIYGSDINDKVLQLANSNLALLNEAGIKKRINQLTELYNLHGKQSHGQAIKSANNLKNIVLSRNNTIEYNCFTADATQSKLKANNVDMVITDLPYGDIVNWANEESNEQAANKLLTNLIATLNPHAVVAVINNKKIKTIPHNYKRIKYFKLGKRHVHIYQLCL